MSRVLAVAPALPAHVHRQEEISAVIGPLLAGPALQARVRALHRSSTVRTRHLALPLERYAGLTSFGEANDLFIELGTDLAERAARDALARAGLAAADVDLVVFTSVTGISAPSIDALLVPRLGLREDVRRVPSFGWGCAGGAAGLATVHDHLAGRPGDVALLVSVELCSLTVQHGDDSIANLVSSGLFGDGAAAVVLVGDAHPAAAGAPAAVPEVVGRRSRIVGGTSDQLGWRIGAGGFRIVLAAGLPEVLRSGLADDVGALLEEYDLKVRDVGAWVVHAGGPRILDAVRDALDLDESALAVSRRSLAEVGNLSSASVLHVLHGTLDAPPPPGSWGVLMAFGPGVGAEYVLLHWPEA
ncbi:type III polyketide synthase [Actinotalea ferrariae]|uniref:type III polyketide synthase n=1 Tax=Actinotalea ferrariae TaxID=1386098 RepID=UPI001C8B5E5C|nr:3-oxoacyl-[acyl-carrier-protein] synthase III C-terminal domain-containing protein [Actinotalea ferrariae]MBX9246791.1 type III polyketide synthase [Actinotalea ferrariae]